MSKIVAVMPGDVDGGESPSEVEIKAGDELGNHRVGKERIGVEICGETRFFAGASSREEEIAGPDFDLLQFLVAVLDRKDVVGVGFNGGMGEGFVFDIGLDDVFITGILPLAMPVGPCAVSEKAEALSLMGRAGAVKNRPSCDVGGQGHRSDVNGAVELFKEFDAGRLEVLERGDELIGVVEVEIGSFDEIRRDHSRILDLNRAGHGVKSGQILFDRFEWVGSRAHFE